ncbi:probable polygalacturonase At3g15720 [Cornus florida]|uniref:probable polygalacturonase At3g15720 n=1 Tax=Cornus florida TaxID=4283 RepID=UPI0028A2D8E2|nr:probable polygalacturonase At3g15720 [Cornus florida]
MVAITIVTANICLAATFNVMSYGATGDGLKDDTKAFLQAWGALCGHVEGGTPTMTIPKGKTFLLRPVKFQGPCKSPSVRIQIEILFPSSLAYWHFNFLHNTTQRNLKHFDFFFYFFYYVYIQVLGTILAPKSIHEWRNCEADSWLFFSDVNGLIINGPGVINGRGEPWWKVFIDPNTIFDNSKVTNADCVRPTGVYFDNCNGLRLNGLKHINSPRNHIAINGCKGVTLTNLNISAPESSPNTDGIDIASSTQVLIQNSTIATGDDCVALNGGSLNITIIGVDCGPGHGISVGSLGRNGALDYVQDVYVRNCSFTRTQNGARIKTWPGGDGYAKNIYFEDITLTEVENPIIINQNYCNGGDHCEKEKGTAVQVSHVSYRNVRGSSATTEAIKLDCSKIVGCSHIEMQQIDITPAIEGSKILASCKNANGKSSSTSPSVPCLSQ